MMKKIKISTTDHKTYFEIPYEWLPKGGLKPKLNDLEASANRGKTTGYLFRKRMAEVPEYTLDFKKGLKQGQLKELWSLIRNEKLLVFYFCQYENQYVEREIYIPKPDTTISIIPENDNTDDIVFDSFTLDLIGYGDI